MKVMCALDPNRPTQSKKKVSAASNKLDFKKRCGKLKGRKCTYGRPQRCYIPKEDASLPTIYLEDLFTSLIIDIH